ncbi:hypothetical protein BC629DRAFT_370837 [Irpex lacteus]|nr:hypothetical protein BC629DRAFT_370837 [Irpex lacteus]
MTVEAQCDYVAACIQKLQRQRIKYIVPKKQAVEDFQAYLDSYFPRTVSRRNTRDSRVEDRSGLYGRCSRWNMDPVPVMSGSLRLWQSTQPIVEV